MEQTQTESPTISPADITALRDRVASLVPGIVPELLNVGSIPELVASIEASKNVYDRITQATTPAADPNPAAPATTPEPPTGEQAPPAPQAPAVPGGGATTTLDPLATPAHLLIKRGLEARSTGN